ncbi:HU family DNA-binding protein [Parabacteroides sp.]
MGIKYKLVQRKDFSKDAPKDGKKYFAQAVNNETVSFDEFCESVAEESALTSGDVKSFMDRMTKTLRRHLKEGRNVQMGELGSFRMAAGSKGADTIEEFNAATMMKKPSLVFTAGKALQEIRSQITFERVKDKNEGGGSNEDDRSVIE